MISPRLLHRLTAGRPRLAAATLGGFLLYLLLPAAMPPASRLILAWDCGVAAFLALSLAMMAGASPQRMRFRAQLQDTSAWIILVLTIAAALSSIAAIFSVMQYAKEASGARAGLALALAGVTILLSWSFAHTMFALHYAHAFYGDRPTRAERHASGGAGGLLFPNEPNPDYWDFLYFSFVVGMTCQVSDVQVASRALRRLTLGHGLIAFLFNTVILALSINLAASLL
jgi:uncharacterized membrane protein